MGFAHNILCEYALFFVGHLADRCHFVMYLYTYNEFLIFLSKNQKISLSESIEFDCSRRNCAFVLMEFQVFSGFCTENGSIFAELK